MKSTCLLHLDVSLAVEAERDLGHSQTNKTANGREEIQTNTVRKGFEFDCDSYHVHNTTYEVLVSGI
jgi:hypothetical protein